MKRGLILYQSRYGATKKYADLLADITGFDCVETKKAGGETARDYPILLFCGGIYASGIAGLSFLRKHFDGWKDKKIAVFCVGASPYDENALDGIKKLNLKGGLSHIPLFYGRGAWDEERMTFWHRTLCRLLQKAVAKRDPDTCEPWMKALLCAAGQTCDWTDKAYLSPLLAWLEGVGANINAEGQE